MKKTIFSLLFCLFSISGMLLAQNSPTIELYPIKQNGKWGLMDESGKIVIPAEYNQPSYIYKFKGYQLSKNGKVGLASPTGEMLIPVEYDRLGREGGYYFCYKAGKVAIGNMHEGKFRLSAQAYSEIQGDTSFNKLRVVNTAQNGERLHGILHAKTLEELLPPTFTRIKIENEFWAYTQKDGAWRTFNFDKMVFSDKTYDNIIFGGRGGIVKMDGKWQILYDLDKLDTARYDTAHFIGYGLFRTFRKGKVGIATERAEVVVPTEYEGLDFIPGGFAFLRGGQWGVMDIDLNEIVPPQFASIFSYPDSLLLVSNNEKYGIVDPNGKTIIPLNWDYITREPSGFFQAQRGSRFTTFSQSGKRIEGDVFDSVGKFSKGDIAIFKKNGKSGVINIEGEVQLPAVYDEIKFVENDVVRVLEDGKKELRIFEKGKLTNQRRLVIIGTDDKAEERGTPRLGGATSRASGDYAASIEPLGWFYDGRKRLWGYRNPVTLDTILKPYFTEVQLIGRTGISMGVKRSRNPNGKDRIGLVNHEEGKMIAKPIFKDIEGYDFKRGDYVRGETMEGAYVLIGRSGKNISHPGLAYISRFKGEYARFNFGGRIKVVNRKSNKMLEFFYNSDLQHSQSVEVEGGKWGIITRSGEKLMKPQYDYISDIKDGTFLIEQDKKWGVYSMEKGEVLPPRFDQLDFFPDRNGWVVGTQEFTQFAFIDTLEGMAILPQFDEVRPFSEGLAAVAVDGKWGYINRKGEWITPPTYELAGDFSEGLARVRLEREFFFIRTDGSPAFGEKYAKVRDFQEGRAPVNQKRLWGFLGTDGNTAIQPAYLEVEPFVNGVAKVKTSNGFGLIGLNGNIILEPNFEEIGEFSDGFAMVRKNGKYGIATLAGTLVVPTKYDEVSLSPQGIFAVKKGKSIGYLNQSGEWQFKSRFQEGRGFSDGFAAVKKGQYWGFIREDGSWLVDPIYHKVKDFREGVAAANLEGKWYLLNKNGGKKEVVGATGIFEFQDGRAIFAGKNRKYGMIDLEGNIQVEPIFHSLKTYSGGWVEGKIGKLWRYFDKKGNPLLTQDYEERLVFSEGLAAFQPKTLRGVYTLEGEVVLPMEFAEIFPTKNLICVKNGGALGYMDYAGKWVFPLSR